MKTINNFIIEKLKLNNSFMTNERLTLNNQSKLKLSKWSIEDAKDGDIITDVRKFNNTKSIYIFKEIKYMPKLKTKMIMAYCYYDFDKKMFAPLNDDHGCFSLDGYDNKHFDYWLSNKDEKREFFNAMKNEGYTWDSIKKELKKI